MPALQKLPRMPARQGPGKEKLSLLQEAEQLLIKDSVSIGIWSREVQYKQKLLPVLVDIRATEGLLKRRF